MQVSCSFCDGLLEVSAANLGQQVNCSHCMLDFELTAASLVEEKEGGSAAAGSWLTSSFSMIVSMAVHMALLVICALIYVNRPEFKGIGNEVRLGALPSEQLTDAGEESMSADASEAVTASESSETFDVEVVVPEEPNGTATLSETLQAIESSDGNDSDSELLGDLSTFEDLSGGGNVSFMGSTAKGRRFCIIADCSGSMVGDPLDHVRLEVLETVSGMRGIKQFQVIFFNHLAVPFPERRWCRQRSDRSKLERWLADDVRASGGTDPMPAFREAFELSPRPDAIFFMTDGAFSGSVPAAIAALNSGNKKVVINTISFQDATARTLMERIAEDSGGKYRHVP